MKKVIVTGVTGQDGSHMCDFLLANTDYMIYGSARRLSVKNHENIIHLENNSRFQLINMDLNDAHSIRDVVLDIKPDYFINFAAQSFVAGSWDYPIQTWDTDATSVLHILESIRRFSPNTRFYNAGSSEEFGDVITSPQDEEHPLRPQSPYGASKCAARHIVRVYSESYNLFAVQGWLFNHEGSRRGLDFVTRKITHNVARIKKAIEEKKDIPVFELGNLDAKRDWSDAEDFMPGVWMMLNQDKAKNYVLSSGETHTIREFAEECFKCAEIYGDWVFPEGNQDAENEVYELCGDATKAINELGWIPKCSFKELVRKMYKTDYNLLNE
jgi:GDPmannose 4,6-dehydratase